MSFDQWLNRRRSRAVWRDANRKIRTLESYAQTELDGGRDIGYVIDKVVDNSLRAHLRKHASDELRHAELFRNRAAELRHEVGARAPEGNPLTESRQRGRSRADLDAHGFFTAGMFDEMGEVAYVAMLNVAEEKAESLFKMHRELTADDPRTQAIFEEIIRDERHHVAYPASILERWRAEGRGREIQRARASIRGGRLWSQWTALGARSGSAFSRVLLGVVYLTLLAPFGLFARRGAERVGWAELPASGAADAERPDSLAELRSQY